MSAATPFGRPMREHFLFEPGNININHGSFGAFPKPVLDVLRSYQRQVEANPDSFLRYEVPGLLDQSRQLLAKLLHVPDVDELVIVPNATTGVNTVLRNLSYAPGDKIVYLSTAYGACEKTIDHITETTPAEAVRIEVAYPMSDDELVTRFSRTLAEHAPVKVAMFDTVSSLPGVRIPFERLVEACRAAGVLSLIDGAHGVGCIPLDLGKLDADFFVSNCHKWLYVPRGCAVLHVPKRNQDLIRSSFPTSHGYVPVVRPGKVQINNPLPPSAKSRFVQMFEFVGTMDYAPYLCVPAALKFRQDVCGGEEAIINYCSHIAQEGAKRVATILGTEVMAIDQPCPLVNVRLPIEPPRDLTTAEAQQRISAVNAFVGKMTVREYKTFVPTIFHNGCWWARLSGQIYLTLDDFERVGRILRDICDRASEASTSEQQQQSRKNACRL
ncbi:hypothetical protein VTN77DRAFT_8112 [Rasamsonia byssochlamydoides]|uniref:uncharacterized protein n=1 Tax=Rasamsonia byssochlamydoides TaxID=89139 RepID=UPI003743BCE4